MTKFVGFENKKCYIAFFSVKIYQQKGRNQAGTAIALYKLSSTEHTTPPPKEFYNEIDENG